ncbi:MAG TPA: hypothetical protein VGJ62_11125 [Gemmatimonadaceae bacterium]|jgi:hypothetical protein
MQDRFVHQARFLARVSLLLISLASLGLSACSLRTAPSAPLAGAWRTAPIPSGSGIDLSLATSGDIVSGTGHQYNLQYLADSLEVTGRQQPGATFRLTLTFGSGTVATYTGQLVGSDELDGTWSPMGQSSYRLVFYRQHP